MRPLNIAVCEDDARDMARLVQLVEGCATGCRCRAFESCEALLEGYRPGDYDLVILDIYMAGIKGVEAASVIRGLDDGVVLAFCTTSVDHALDSYRLGALKYLEKPIGEEAVRETLALAEMKRGARKKISLPAGGRVREVALDDILYFEMSGHSVLVHLDGETLRASQSIRLEDIEVMAPPPQFLRCHRGVIVNLRRVKGFDGADFVMEDGRKAYVRLRDSRKMKAAFDDYMIALTRGGRG